MQAIEDGVGWQEGEGGLGLWLAGLTRLSRMTVPRIGIATRLKDVM